MEYHMRRGGLVTNLTPAVITTAHYITVDAAGRPMRPN